MLSIEYCARGIVAYLNGNIKLFEEYRNKAIEMYEEEKYMVSIGEMIPARTKEKLYKLVS